MLGDGVGMSDLVRKSLSFDLAVLAEAEEIEAECRALVHQMHADRSTQAEARVGERLRYLLMAPGWSHDGPDRRAKALRSEAGL